MRPDERARDHLERVIFPFWLDNGIDTDYGGFFTCFDNRGRRRVAEDKFSWSQGRFVWLLAHAAGMARRGLLGLDADHLLTAARAGARFLLDHAVRPDGTCAYVVDRLGGPAGEADRSVYADCFVAMGLYELAGQTGERSWFDAAERIVTRACADIEAGDAPTAPYLIPRGYAAFGPRMIALNTRLVQAQTRDTMGLRNPLGDLATALTAMMAHRGDDGLFREMIGADERENSLLTNHRTPGHALEGLWMALAAGELVGDTEAVAAAVASVGPLCESGWDPRYGGLFRYADAAGPCQPHGGSSGSDYEDLIERTWSTKLWWVHTEACYTTYVAARRYGDDTAAAWFERIWNYTLATFPGGDLGAEWIQIRDRAGRPLDEVVALPVKDPYHISRNLMQIVEFAEKENS